jgi:hypothetical protein
MSEYLANQHYSIANPIALSSRNADIELTGLVDFRSDPSSDACNHRGLLADDDSSVRASVSLTVVMLRLL